MTGEKRSQALGIRLRMIIPSVIAYRLKPGIYSSESRMSCDREYLSQLKAFLS
jgi:hypothetical protein